MFDQMYEAKGIGLAANQIDLPLRLFIVNLEGKRGVGEEFVFINPVISLPRGGAEEVEEGCLSLPGLFGQVMRPKQVRINAYSIGGQEIEADMIGLLARCCQHELDHLDGVLFPDRMSTTARADIEHELEIFESEFTSRRTTGAVPSDEAIAQRWTEWEERYA